MSQLINRRLLEDQNLWSEINQQTTLFLTLFTELSNEYRQDHLSKLIASSKGCKVTKGLQLQGHPYQVLDIIRNFNDEDGFNIRILNWWGHGLYIVILAGKNRRQGLMKFAHDHSEYEISVDSDIWNYGKILHSTSKNPLEIKKNQHEQRVQLFKKNSLPYTIEKLKECLSKEIDRILEYPW